MKVLDISDLPQRIDTVKNEGWYWALQNSIKSVMKRYPNAVKGEHEQIFEEENKCKIHYKYEGQAPTVIIFEREQDWVMFVLRWA